MNIRITDAALCVLIERERQKLIEGWTEANDDEHTNGSMAQAAACYAATTQDYKDVGFQHHDEDQIRDRIPVYWPWRPRWWKPKDRRSDLVRAGALILAEIERLDRALNPSVTVDVAGAAP